MSPRSTAVLTLIVTAALATVAAADCTLRGAARAAGVQLGSAVAPALLTTEPPYAATLAAEYNSVTAENVMKWGFVQGERGVFDFEQADALVDFAEAHGMAIRGHALIWDQDLIDSTPPWVSAISDPDELRAVLTDHIQTVVSRYAGRIDAWDVVNEPLQTGGAALYENVFFQVLGPGYIREALEIARAADPNARLFVNEIFVSSPGAKLDAMLALVEGLLASGAPLDGVGVQGHFLFAPDGTALRQSLEALAATGVSVELTEVDILPRGPGDAATRFRRQGDDYRSVVSACLAVPACRRITTWGFTDLHTWLDSLVGPGSSPLPFDTTYARKPAFFGMRQAFDAAAGAERPVTGKKLDIRSGDASSRLVLRSRDPAIAPSFVDAGADPSLTGATLRLLSAAQGTVGEVELPAQGWQGLGSPRGSRGYRYKHRDGGPCRTAVIKRGLLKVVCRDGEVLALAGEAQGAVAATLRLGCGPVHCMDFGGTVSADQGGAVTSSARFAAKNAPAPTHCIDQY